jgi:PAS domain S-box-containing protein
MDPIPSLLPVVSFAALAAAIIVFYLTARRRSARDNRAAEPSADTIALLPDGVAVLQNEHIVYANPAALALLGYDAPEDLAPVRFTDCVAPESRSFAGEIYARGLSEQYAVRNYDLRFQMKNGGAVDAEISTSAIEWQGAPAVLCSMRDVGERKLNEREQALWLWEQDLLNRVERRLISTVDLQKVLDMIVEHAQRLTRADLAAVLTIDPEKQTCRWLAMKGNRDPFPADFSPLGVTAKLFYHESELRAIDDIVNDQRYRASDFELFVDERIVTVLQVPLVRGSIVFGHLAVGYRSQYELTDRMMRIISSYTDRATVAILNAELYDQLRKQTKNLQHMYETRMQVQEEERRRIATELHDSLGQLLTSIKLHLELLGDSNGFDKNEEKAQVDEIRSLLDTAIDEARNISYDLRPSILDDFGLIPALEVLCEKFTARTGIPAAFRSHNCDRRLEGRIETMLYRIAQEALNNVQKHAGASEVSVQMIRTPSTINLVIEDNGKGFVPGAVAEIEEPGAAGRRPGMGLAGMQERAARFDGTMTVDSTPGKGTDIIIEVPLNDASHEKNSGDTR